jgi:hypothetical protein
MNAIWCLHAMKHFGTLIADTLGWPIYVECPLGDDVETVYIIGMYDAPDYDFTLDCTKKAKRRVISWCGSDVSMLTRPEMLPDAVHLCETPAMQSELLEKGIDAQIVMFPTRVNPLVTPLVDEPTISFYAGSDANQYGAATVRYVMECIPEAKWHVYHLGQHAPEQIAEVVANTRVHVRFTRHDGASASCREHMEAGRRVVATTDLPHVKRVSLNDPVGIVRAVRTALKAPEPDLKAAGYYSVHNAPERFVAEFNKAVRL